MHDHRAAPTSVSVAVRLQLVLQDHGYGAIASCDVPVYAPGFAGINLYCLVSLLARRNKSNGSRTRRKVHIVMGRLKAREKVKITHGKCYVDQWSFVLYFILSSLFRFVSTALCRGSTVVCPVVYIVYSKVSAILLVLL